MQRRLTTLEVRSGDDHLSIPIVDCRGDTPGPTVVVSANVHGDEVCGTLACHALNVWLSEHLVAGRVVVFPSLNPGGMAARCRVEPCSSQDLNRHFPAGGIGLGGAVVRALWRELQSIKPELVLDLHSDSPHAIPYVLLDRAIRLPGPERLRVEREARSAAEASGLFVVRDFADEEYEAYGLERSLTGAVTNRLRRPALTMEAGARRGADADAVTALLAACTAILRQRGLASESLESQAMVGSLPGRWRRAIGPRTRAAGLVVPMYAPGESFEAGDVLAVIRSPAGREVDRLRASHAGIVLSWCESAWVDEEQVCGMFAVEDEDE